MNYMRTELVINGIILLVVSFVLNILRGFVGGIFDILLLIAVILLVVVGFIRLIEGIIASPRKVMPRTIHHVHHYPRPKKRPRKKK